MQNKNTVGYADQYDWRTAGAQLADNGFAVLNSLLEKDLCTELRTFYTQEQRFRKKVIMARHGFGRGEYQYFTYPLPEIVHTLRHELYAKLAPIANLWNQQLSLSHTFPQDLSAYLDDCHRKGQTRPTPLLLKYGASDYNCLHQDLYGDEVFPLQVVVQLSRPLEDFIGGELVMTEQRPRMQSRVSVIPLQQGDAAIIPVNIKPKLGGRGFYRVNMRHGVSEVRRGERYTLGIIFHDAK